MEPVYFMFKQADNNRKSETVALWTKVSAPTDWAKPCVSVGAVVAKAGSATVFTGPTLLAVLVNPTNCTFLFP